MNERATPEDVSRSESFGTRTLWFAVLGAPIAWVTHMMIGYSTEEWFACSPSTTHPGEMFGLDVRTFVVILTVVMALVALAALLAAISCLRKIGPAEDTNRRPRWMAIAGIMNSVLYLLIILGGLGPALILDVCERSP
jgi:hypothetical protein